MTWRGCCAPAPCGRSPEPRPARPSRRAGAALTVPRGLRSLLAALAGAAAGLALVGPLARTEASVGPGEVEVAAVPAWDGSTVVALPPLGRVEAQTHPAPLALTARVLAVDVEAAQATTTGTDPVGRLREEVDAALPGLLRRVALRALGVAVVAGAVAGLVLPGRRRWLEPALGAAGGVLAVGGLLLGTWYNYDINAFREPAFSGELRRVPGLLRAVERNLEGIDQVRDRVDVVSTRLAELYAASVGELPGGAAGETAILFVSDLHLNPLGAELVVQLAGDLEVDAVLDTGDVTSFGLAVESAFGELLEEAPVPYYVIPGNHDSEANRRQLDALAGIDVVDGEVITVGGVRILGIADPTFTADNEVSTDEANAIKAALTDDLRREVRRLRPDVLAVHDPAQAADAVGEVPVVIAGHVHRTAVEQVDGTWVLTVGSSGATGLGSFTVETSRRYEAEVLRFRDGVLVAVDHLSMAGIDGSFDLQRRLIEPPDDEEEDEDEDEEEGKPGEDEEADLRTSTSR